MTRRDLLVAGAGAAALAGGAGAAGAPFVRAYNGKDLSGWHVESGKLSSWKALGEIVSCVSPGGGYLALDREYGDFELRLEYRLPPAGNSGIGIRFPRGGWPSTEGMEIQLLDDEAPRYKNLKPDQFNGAIYTHIAPKVRASRPAGEWNRIAVRCKGPVIQIRLNDVEIQNANIDDYPDSVGKGTLPLPKRPRKGLVGLQSHGDPVEFRNIEIREL